MAIKQGTYDDCGKKRRYVEIDLADARHKNRVLSFLKGKNPLTGKTCYDIKAQWTRGKFHPSMTLSRKELLALSEALAEMARPKSRSKGK